MSKKLNFKVISFADELVAHGARQILLRHSTRSKRTYLKVKRGGDIEVVLPPRAALKSAISFIEQNRSWLVNSLQKMDLANYQGNLMPESIELNAINRLFHIQYHHTVNRSRCNSGKDNHLSLFITDDNQWKPLLHRWLAKTAKEHLIPWLRDVSVEHELPFNHVSVRGQKGRWGSCSSAANININYKLLFLAPDLVEYLFIHELCHTIYPNHSPQFWSLVDYHLPDYKKSDRLLRQSMAAIPHWAAE